jgi:hypothetical protein
VRGFSLGAIALVAACSGDGVYIEVRVPEGMTVDQVDLYLATGGCDPDEDGFCDGIVPPGRANAQRDRVDGEVYFVDDNRPFVSVPDGDGSAWFHLDPSELEIKTAIAVGRDLAGGETGVAIFQPIDLDVTQHVRIALEPVASQEVRGMAQPAVEVWSPTSDDYRCVAAEIQNRVVYIVPRNDPDCDQVTGEECFPGVHLGKQAVSPALIAQSCTTTQANGLCVLGSEGCDETNMSDSAGRCTTSPAVKYCVPDRTCGCDNLGLLCLKGLFDDEGTSVLCTVEAEPDPLVANGKRSCPAKPVAGADISNGSCRDAEVAILADGLAGFGPTANAPVAGTTGYTLAAVTDGGCKVGLAAPNASFPTGILPPATHSLVKLALTPPGSQVEKFMILPLKVVFVDINGEDCANSGGTKCELVTANGEHLAKCFE